MYKQCRTEQSANRQRLLEEGLLKAMTAQHYDEISVSDLCAQMEIPRKSFYRYFSSKEGALHALLDHALLDFESFAGPYFTGDQKRMQQDMERVFAYWQHRKPLLDALRRSNLSGVLIQRAIEHALSESAFHRSFLPSEDRTAQEYVTMFAVCGMMSMVVQWHHDGYPQSIHQMAQIAVRLLSRPLFPDAESISQESPTFV